MLNVASPGILADNMLVAPAKPWSGSARLMRELILKESFRAHVGHIGSALCVVEILEALYAKILKIDSIKEVDRDRFILSKGHAALGLYAALYCRGLISEAELSSFCSDNSMFGVHPEPGAPGIDFGTGSLGQGLSFAAGAALAARWQKSQRRVFVLLSDAELNEGSIWEAAMFAGHHKLANLCAVVDLNKQQAFGYTKDVIDLPRIKEIWQGFHWDVHEINGHDSAQLVNSMQNFNYMEGAPHIILAHTVFGKGVSFMENQIKWHYSPLSKEELEQALQEVSRS